MRFNPFYSIVEDTGNGFGFYLCRWIHFDARLFNPDPPILKALWKKKGIKHRRVYIDKHENWRIHFFRMFIQF